MEITSGYDGPQEVEMVPRSTCARSSVLMSVLLSLLVSQPSGDAVAQPAADDETVAAGERLVALPDCNVCHTPKVFATEGPRPDSSRLLSGHPSDEELLPLPGGLIGPEGWGGVFSNGMTAWSGPWGTTFGTNLTPHAETGIGDWSEDVFSDAIRAGAHVGGARPVLPPMPVYARLTDEELHAIFTYLQSIEPVENHVPEVVPPPKRQTGGE